MKLKIAGIFLGLSVGIFTHAESVTNLQIGIDTATNGMVELELGWPVGFGDRLEIFATTNLTLPVWQLVHTNITTFGLSQFLWGDPSSTNLTQQFYIIGNADLDSDTDGLADARELYLTHTRPDLEDTDTDGALDGAEVARGTDPNDVLSKNILVYGNSDIGSDLNDGYAPNPEGEGRGPKLKVQGALDVAISGDTVQLGGASIFNETGVLTASGKQILLKSVGNIILK